jgi:hypothetical protein
MGLDGRPESPGCTVLIPDLWRQSLKSLALLDLGPLIGTNRLFTEEYMERLVAAGLTYIAAAKEHWGQKLLDCLRTIVADCSHEGRDPPDFLPKDRNMTSVAAVIAQDGSVSQLSKGEARWYNCFKKDRTVMVAHSESLRGGISLQISGDGVLCDIIGLSSSRGPLILGYAQSSSSIPRLVGLLLFFLQALGSSTSASRSKSAVNAAEEGIRVAAISITIADPCAKFTIVDLEKLFSPLLHVVSCCVTLTPSPCYRRDYISFSVVRPLAGQARSVLLKPALHSQPSSEWDTIPACTPPALTVNCSFLC